MNLTAARDQLFSERIYPFFALSVVSLVIGLFYVIGFEGGMRWVKLLMGLMLIVAIFATRLSAGIGLFLLASLFPAFIVTGPTNFPLVILMSVFWIAKASVGQEARPMRTPCDIPLLLLTVAYAISWTSVDRTPFAMQQAWWYTQNHIGSLLIFYMSFAAVREEKDMDIIVRFMQIMAFIIYLTALLEVVTGVAILGLGTVKGALYRFGDRFVRAGGTLGSHDMLADFCSMNMPLHLFLFIRARAGFLRVVYGTLVVMCIVAMFMTSNRGGLIGFTVGLVYLAFLLRKEFKGRVMVAGAAIGIPLVVLVDAVLSWAGKTISVFGRLFGTQFFGVLPETRVGVFDHFKERISKSFWLGEGPYYRLGGAEAKEFITWPHNAFGYYWVTVGMLGLISFAVLMFRVIYESWKEKARRLGEGRARDMLLILHVVVVVFLVTEQRTDFQRGYVFTYYVYCLLGFTLGTWRLARSRPREAVGGS